MWGRGLKTELPVAQFSSVSLSASPSVVSATHFVEACNAERCLSEIGLLVTDVDRNLCSGHNEHFTVSFVALSEK